MSDAELTFLETGIPGAYLIRSQVKTDARGYFARTFDSGDFERHGLVPPVAQCSVSYNEHAGTLRGMHWQGPPHGEDKLVTCLHGRVYDVFADVRAESPAFGKSQSVELAGITLLSGVPTLQMLYVPPGVAHGFQTLEDHSIVHYQMSVEFDPQGARGFRWDDPFFSIQWPLPVTHMSTRDRDFPLLVREPGTRPGSRGQGIG